MRVMTIVMIDIKSRYRRMVGDKSLGQERIGREKFDTASINTFLIEIFSKREIVVGGEY